MKINVLSIAAVEFMERVSHVTKTLPTFTVVTGIRCCTFRLKYRTLSQSTHYFCCFKNFILIRSGW